MIRAPDTRLVAVLAAVALLAACSGSEPDTTPTSNPTPTETAAPVEPTAGIVDSQSVKSTDVGGPGGFDAGKKVKGRKRHLLVDVLGLILVVLVTPASVQDRDGAAPVLREAHRGYPTLKRVWADSAYRGEVIDRVQGDTGINVEVVKRTDAMSGFVVLPRR